MIPALISPLVFFAVLMFAKYDWIWESVTLAGRYFLMFGFMLLLQTAPAIVVPMAVRKSVRERERNKRKLNQENRECETREIEMTAVDSPPPSLVQRARRAMTVAKSWWGTEAWEATLYRREQEMASKRLDVVSFRDSRRKSIPSVLTLPTTEHAPPIYTKNWVMIRFAKVALSPLA